MKKHLINDPVKCVDDFLTGYTLAHRGLIQLPGHRVILRRDIQEVKGKVALLSGGGAGHEPAHAGFVGKGMLTGSVSGAIFTSPPSSSIIAAIRYVYKFKPDGILLIVTNYTGDRLNFGIAKEWAMSKAIKIEMVIVDDDCASLSKEGNAGRRGLAGTILIHKIAGALSEKGVSIDNIVDILKESIKNIGTIGVCLQPCVLLDATTASFKLGESEMELGLGVHGEAGVRREKLRTCSEVIEVLLNHMDDIQSSSRFPLVPKTEVVVLINNLGGTSNLEMGIVIKDVVQALEKKALIIKRIYSGSFMTSLQMAGISLTIFNLISTSTRKLGLPSLLQLLDMETNVTTPLIGERSLCIAEIQFDMTEDNFLNTLPEMPDGPIISLEKANMLKKCIKAICTTLKESEVKLNVYDTESGDGDCGSTHSRGVKGIEMLIGEDEDYTRPAKIFQKVGNICSEQMGGSSGALYSIFLTATARYLATSLNITKKEFAKAFEKGLLSVKQYGGAELGDRTMVDVLQPLSEALNSLHEEPLSKIAEQLAVIGKNAAKVTLNMLAKAGRASYVHATLLKHPDPGAEAISIMVCACAKVLSTWQI